MRKWFWSMRPVTAACLRWAMVGWIVISVWFAVSVLSVFTILTDPPISVVRNNIWAGCFVPVIRLLVIRFPSGVIICLDYDSRLLIQVRKYFAVPTLIFLLVFCSIVSLVPTVLLTICSILLLASSSNVLLASGSIVSLAIILLVSSFFLKLIWRSYWCSSSIPFFLLWGYTITINGNFHNIIEMCSTLSQIRCTSFWFLVTTGNIGLQV